MKAKILKYCFLALIPSFTAGKLQAQFPSIYIIPLDSIVFDSSQIKGMEFITYNEDIYIDYFFSNNTNAFLIDGYSKDTLWTSPVDTLLKHENIEFVASAAVWRNYRIEKIGDNIYKVLWYDLPSTTPSDSLIFESSYSNSVYPELYAGYFHLNGSDGFYVQPSIERYYDATYFNQGEMRIYGNDNDSVYYSALCPRYLENSPLHYNTEYYFIVAGNTHYSWWELGGGQADYFSLLVFYDTLGIMPAIDVYNVVVNSTDIWQQDDNTPPRILLAGSNHIILYPNVFNDSTYILHYFPVSRCYSRFFNYYNSQKVLNATFNNYFEIWDANLNFNYYIENQLSDTLKNIYTQDIDFDGTDEVFCVYDSKVIICGLFENVGIADSEIIPYKIGFKNYPNPFNSRTNISYTLSSESETSLSIYDILGRELAILFSGHQSAGTHTISWDASDYPSGVYFARLKSSRHSENIKMVLLK